MILTICISVYIYAFINLYVFQNPHLRTTFLIINNSCMLVHVNDFYQSPFFLFHVSWGHPAPSFRRARVPMWTLSRRDRYRCEPWFATTAAIQGTPLHPSLYPHHFFVDIYSTRCYHQIFGDTSDGIWGTESVLVRDHACTLTIFCRYLQYLVSSPDLWWHFRQDLKYQIGFGPT